MDPLADDEFEHILNKICFAKDLDCDSDTEDDDDEKDFRKNNANGNDDKVIGKDSDSKQNSNSNKIFVKELKYRQEIEGKEKSRKRNKKSAVNEDFYKNKSKAYWDDCTATCWNKYYESSDRELRAALQRRYEPYSNILDTCLHIHIYIYIGVI